jgi:hypothetical protein
MAAWRAERRRRADPAAELREICARRARRDRGAKERAYWDFLKAQIGKSYDKLAIAAFAFNRDWRSPNAWFCDELVAAGLEHAEVVRKLAPCVNRLDVRDLYLLVSAIAR